MHELPPDYLLAVQQQGPGAARLVTNLGPLQTLQLLAPLCEQLRVQAALQTLQAEQRVQLVPADHLPGKTS